MKLIETKCPNCNSNLEVENNKKKVECKYCGTTFLLDDNTVNVRHISAGQITDEQEFINAETNLNKFKNYEEAYRLYLSLSKRFVDNPEIWIGLLRSITHDFKHKVNSNVFQKNCTTYWNNYCSLVDREEINKYMEKYRTYLESVDAVNPYGTAVSNDINTNNNVKVKEQIKYKEVKEESCFLVVTILFGMYGVHKFLRGKVLLGLVYLFTGGLFGIGWIYDIVQEYKNFPNSGQRKALKWIFSGFLILMALLELPYSFWSFLLLASAGILCFDFFWNKINFNKTWARIAFPVLLMFLGLIFGTTTIPESSYGKWVASDDALYPTIILDENDSKIYTGVNDNHYSVNTSYYNDIIYISIDDETELEFKYDSSERTLCLLKNSKCIEIYKQVE